MFHEHSLNFKIFQFLRHVLPRKGYGHHPVAALCAAVRQQHGHTVASLQQGKAPGQGRRADNGMRIDIPGPFAEAVADAFRIRCGSGSQNLLTHRCTVLLIPYRAQRELL